ncbi:13620_t:CDS:2 [Ambispora gerdemannii]|uniref:13620_t:CDS:1 n=1 Tax=Ambispora gerdemannii TaxID=144530 RepID=A0A9N9C827_9GLOM|nr:13620_t:CDS:2 [Ambispora gerdemannii]
MSDFKLPRNTEFYSVTITTIALHLLNLFGSAYIFYRTFRYWREREYKSLAMSHRLPLYAASTDFLTAGLSIINGAYTLCNSKTLPEIPCAATGWATAILSFINQFIFLGISIITYLRVCQHKPIELGRFDYKLFTFSCLLTGIALAIVSRDGYGAQKYWCANKVKARASLITPIVEIISVTVISLACYAATLRALVRNRRELKKGTVFASQYHTIDRIEERVTRKIITYVLFFNLQWLPIAVYAGAALTEAATETWVYYVGVIGLSFGGIGNAIAYVMNEGWLPNYNTSSPPLNSHQHASKDNEFSHTNTTIKVDIVKVESSNKSQNQANI